MPDPQPMLPQTMPSEAVTPPPARTPSARGDLQRERLRSEDVIINAPMSFAGAAQRASRIGRGTTGWKRAAIVAFVIVPLLLVWWWTIIGWYLFFGLWVVPYRLLRRGLGSGTRRLSVTAS
jgi:hypothetical protein